MSKGKNITRSASKVSEEIVPVKVEDSSNDSIDPSLLDIISEMIDQDSVQNISTVTDTHEENMVPAVDLVLPEGVEKVVKDPTYRCKHKKNTRSPVAPELCLVSYINKNDSADPVYNTSNAFELRHIQEMVEELKKSESGFIHPTVFVRMSVKINNSYIVHKIDSSKTFSNKKIFFNPRNLNDLRVKAKDIKEYIDAGTHSKEDIEFRVFGLLAHLNSILDA